MAYWEEKEKGEKEKEGGGHILRTPTREIRKVRWVLFCINKDKKKHTFFIPWVSNPPQLYFSEQEDFLNVAIFPGLGKVCNKHKFFCKFKWVS